MYLLINLFRDPSVQNTEPSYSSYIFSSVSKCVKKVVDFCIEPAADDDVVTTGVKVCNTSAIISCSGYC